MGRSQSTRRLSPVQAPDMGSKYGFAPGGKKTIKRSTSAAFISRLTHQLDIEYENRIRKVEVDIAMSALPRRAFR